MSRPWLINPLINPLFEPLAIILLVLFVLAGLGLLAFQYLHTIRLNNGSTLVMAGSDPAVLWCRYRTWIIIALLFAGANLSGPLTIALLCSFLCWQGTREYALLTGMSEGYRWFLTISGWLTLLATLYAGSSILPFIPVLAFFIWSILLLYPAQGSMEMSTRFMAGLAGLWGYLYLGWLPAHLLALSLGRVPALITLVGFGVALSDVGAFCTGKLIGGPKLAPYLSPNKTWGGALGNLLGATLAVLLMSSALLHLQWWQCGILALAIGVGSLWGDLLESLLKRQRGVKDAGTLLPGFGGLLDRIDSLLLVAPLVYYVALLSGV
jgi:phosphatidate cytidylyltransferase